MDDQDLEFEPWLAESYFRTANSCIIASQQD